MTEDEPSEGTGCGGVVVATAVIALPLLILWAASRDVFILSFWIIGWGAVIWAAKHVPHATNPAPPAPPERGSEKKQQATTMRDTTHPNRWLVLKPSRWINERHDDRDET